MHIDNRIITATRRMPRVAVAIAATVALAFIGVGYAAADTPGVTVSVSPSTGLSDTDTVSVSGTGFAAQASITIFECKPSAPACKQIGTALSDGSGNFGPTSATVSRTFTSDQGVPGTIDCGPEDNCTVYATDSTGKDDSQAISFVSAATTTTTTTIPANPVLTADPNTGLANTQTVALTGTGFTPQASVVLSECKLANGTPQSCATIGSATTDSTGAFSTSVTATRNFTATQGAVQGGVDCGPEDTCVIDATDTGGAQDNAPISFASIANPTSPSIAVDPTTVTAPSGTVSVTGTGFAVGASVVIYECKLNGGGTQSCAVVGSTLSDSNGDFGPVNVTASETFDATQGVTGTTSCLPENDCVIYAIDSLNNDDAQAITFVMAPTTTTTVMPTTTTTEAPSTTTTTVAPPQSSTCNALLSARANFNSTVDAIEALLPALAPVMEPVRQIGNAAFNAALALNNCTSNVFTPAGAASDARVMRSVLPLSVRTALRNAQSSLPTSTTTARTYTVQPGDTLMRIAQRLLGSPANFRMLIAANPSLAAHPNLIHPGQVLVIPG